MPMAAILHTAGRDQIGNLRPDDDVWLAWVNGLSAAWAPVALDRAGTGDGPYDPGAVGLRYLRAVS